MTRPSQYFGNVELEVLEGSPVGGVLQPAGSRMGHAELGPRSGHWILAPLP